MSKAKSLQREQSQAGKDGLGHSIRRALGERVSSVLIILGLIVAWELLEIIFQIPQYLVPAPSTILKTIVSNWNLFLSHLVPTVLEAIGGFLIGNAAAIALAIATVYIKPLERAIMPVAITLRSIPLVALAPLLILLMGSGYESRLVIVAIISFFPTLVNMALGLTAVDSSALELFRSLSATEWQIFSKLRVPSSLPYLFAALKIAATSSVLGAIIAEWIGSNRGLGYLIITSTYRFEAADLYATMVLSSLTAILFFAGINLLEKLMVDW